MRKYLILTAVLLIFAAATDVDAQPPGQRPRPGTNRPGGNNNQPEAPPFKLPDDERLVKIHETFVLSAEKLAQEYEKTGHNDKARACYEEILRLVPTYKPAEEKLAGIKMKQSIAQRSSKEIYANQGWQDSGVSVLAGNPITIRATGSWTLKISYNLPPEGMEIPKELQNFPLGALVGKIADSPTDEEAKIFLIGSTKSFEAERDGRLWLRIYDSDTEDNLGRVSVTMEGTFAKKN